MSSAQADSRCGCRRWHTCRARWHSPRRTPALPGARVRPPSRLNAMRALCSAHSSIQHSAMIPGLVDTRDNGLGTVPTAAEVAARTLSEAQTQMAHGNDAEVMRAKKYAAHLHGGAKLDEHDAVLPTPTRASRRPYTVCWPFSAGPSTPTLPAPPRPCRRHLRRAIRPQSS